MEKSLKLKWKIYNGTIDRVERYCHNCGKKVIFEDSLKRRQNANGKIIFHFAIYKCPKGHTWNKEIDSFKAVSGLENLDGEFLEKASRYSDLRIHKLKEKNLQEVEIFLEVLQEKVRIDKFLAEKIEDVSRNEISKLLENGSIRVNGEAVKRKQSINEKDLILIKIGEI
ncbi:S4 domain-containing protein [Alkaliphilus serpentinus]|uniref:Cytoplasmic protein n=1 Tax=Alkaliphilus serpentinus TaxID=1482731 RepID=A0A833MA82_9FIRM|nr:S4 domain-containing protein [Alkaliphilus serpentinus]KAB3531565.1 cytoplasmic protein [Alkaliphilus serpentinus]